MPKRRTKYEIYAELLDIVARKDPCRLTRASYGANLPVDRAKETLNFLVSRGFLKETIVGNFTAYRITRRGLEYLETFKQMRKLFAALDEKHEITDAKMGKIKPTSKIEAALLLSEDEVNVNEDVGLEVHIANIGEMAVTLGIIEKIIPTNFKVVFKPDNLTRKGYSLFPEEVTIDPDMTETLRLRLQPYSEGKYAIKPRITYRDDKGTTQVFSPEPVTLNVLKAQRPQRLATGYRALDNLLLGGIPGGYGVLITSPPCDERDLLTLKFLEEGTNRRQTTLYVTTDPNLPKAFLRKVDSNFYVLFCNPQADSLIESRPNTLKLQGIENLTDINITLTSAFREINRRFKEDPRRACVGILSDILLEHGAVRTRKWLTGLLSALKSERFTSIVLLNPQMHSKEEVQAVLDPFEGEIDIYEKETKDGLRKFLRIKRMFNQRYLENQMLLDKDELRA